MKVALLVLAIVLWPALASAGLTEQQIGVVALAPQPDAKVPTWLVFRDLQGKTTTLGNAIDGRPTVLLPADYTCKEICGPALSIAAAALQQTGLAPGRDYSLVVVGIDPWDGIDAARRFATGQVGGPGVSVLSGDEHAIHALLKSIGYQSVHDPANDAVAHPAALVTLSAEGQVSRALSSLALQPTDLRLALIEAGNGRIGGVAGRIALLCYGFDAVHGIYTRQIASVLQIFGAVTVAALAGAIGLMLLRARRRGASV